jgi:crossover junction endodeoxyribonuclease RuvC
MKVVGIDPGIAGAAAILEVNGDAAPQLVAVIEIPLAGIKAKQRVDAIALRDWLVRQDPQHAYLERGQAMPRQGSSSGYKYGCVCGAIEAVIACAGVPLSIVEPSQWKRFHGLRGGDKESGRQRALQLLPAAHAELARKKDHGKSDAMLIALYGARALYSKPSGLAPAIPLETSP